MGFKEHDSHDFTRRPLDHKYSPTSHSSLDFESKRDIRRRNLVVDYDPHVDVDVDVTSNVFKARHHQELIGKYSSSQGSITSLVFKHHSHRKERKKKNGLPCHLKKKNDLPCHLKKRRNNKTIYSSNNEDQDHDKDFDDFFRKKSVNRTLFLTTMTTPFVAFILLSNTVSGRSIGTNDTSIVNTNDESIWSTITNFELPLWLNIVCILCLLILSGLFSGLNLGLMALDQNDLKVISSCGTKREKKFASVIAPVRARGNFLLCTLLLGNVLVNTTLTTLLDTVTGSGAIAVASATLSIVIFGEILPQAICSRHGLAVGAKTIGITYIFMALTAPIAYPISVALDKLLGEEIGVVYNREQLTEYIRITRDATRLEDNEFGIITGALALRSKTAKDVMTPLDSVFMLPEETKLNFQTVKDINDRGFSRIPVFGVSLSNLLHPFN